MIQWKPMDYYEISSGDSRSPLRRLGVIFALIVVIGISFAGGFSVGRDRSAPSSNGSVFDGNVTNRPDTGAGEDVDFKLFWDVWNTLKKEYVDHEKLTDKKLFYGALAGIVSATGDPYSIFLNPEEANEFEEDLSGTFEGIGAEIGYRNDVLTIIAPLDDMPAMKAGLRAGDRIYSIDGVTTSDMTVEEAVKKIRGPKGSQVKLTVVRDKEEKPLDFTVTRDTVIVKSIKTTYLEKEKVFVIKVTSFNNDTRALFNDAVSQALAKKPAGIILDLRNNPGGYLDTAVDLASEWIGEGTIVIEQFADGKKVEHASTGSGRLSDVPTAVLVNQGSASASEILAGALKDYGKAKLIGEKTFGKGSVQVLRELSDGSVVKVTTAKWLTPKGSSIHEQGIAPDTVIERSAEDRENGKDPQLDAALKALAEAN